MQGQRPFMARHVGLWVLLRALRMVLGGLGQLFRFGCRPGG
jgi:hypothetical protein